MLRMIRSSHFSVSTEASDGVKTRENIFKEMSKNSFSACFIPLPFAEPAEMISSDDRKLCSLSLASSTESKLCFTIHDKSASTDSGTLKPGESFPSL